MFHYSILMWVEGVHKSTSKLFLYYLFAQRCGTVCGSRAGYRQGAQDSSHSNSSTCGEEVLNMYWTYVQYWQLQNLIFLYSVCAWHLLIWLCPFSLRLKEEDNICVSTDGPWESVVKFKPPMCFSMEDAELVVQCIDRILTGQLPRH